MFEQWGSNQKKNIYNIYIIIYIYYIYIYIVSISEGHSLKSAKALPRTAKCCRESSCSAKTAAPQHKAQALSSSRIKRILVGSLVTTIAVKFKQLQLSLPTLTLVPVSVRFYILFHLTCISWKQNNVSVAFFSSVPGHQIATRFNLSLTGKENLPSSPLRKTRPEPHRSKNQSGTWHIL